VSTLIDALPGFSVSLSYPLKSLLYYQIKKVSVSKRRRLAVPLLFTPKACTHADNGQIPSVPTCSALQLRDEFKIRFCHFSPSNDSLQASRDF
jgi:hypothetical protein